RARGSEDCSRRERPRRRTDRCRRWCARARSGHLPRLRKRGGKTVSRNLERRHYADLFGPTTGDRVRLGDSNLVARVERDETTYGDECKFGGGKVLRDGMGQMAGAADKDALDCVITNALVVDWTGIFKADIGIKGGRIAGIGK